MKKLLIGLVMLGTTSALACDFQGEASDLVKSSSIKCNRISNTATIENPKVEIDGEFFNITAFYGVDVAHFISGNSQDQLCKLFGFTESRGVETKYIYSYLNDAYSLDHDELYGQSYNHAPLESIECI